MSILHDLSKFPKPFVLCTITEVQGSSPGKPGFRMAVFPDGNIKGTIGGGDIERSAIEAALEQISKKIPHITETFVLHTKKNSRLLPKEQQTKMICGGESTVFFEFFEAKPRVLLFGGGHIAQNLAPILEKLDFSVEVNDNRAAYVKKQAYGPDTRVKTGSYLKLAKTSVLDQSTFCCILTHGHAHDYEVLRELLKQESSPAYVGMIGSRIKVKQTLARLHKEDGIPRTRLQKVFTPIGLNIGGESPYEIAISIAAEIQSVRYNREAKHMKT